MKSISRVAPEVGWLPVSFVNVFFLGRPGDNWIVVDAGLRGYARDIIEAAEARFGAGSRPAAIVLTHGHGDHSGSALELAKHWDVPIYVHPMEFPYLTGKSSYPPPDPTVGGAMAFLSRFMSSRAPDMSAYLRPLDGKEVPGISGWEVVETLGHSPGHVVLFRPSDRVLIGGDALATMNMDSWAGLLFRNQELASAGTPFTCDWKGAIESVKRLAELRPNVAACGHGLPICDSDLPARLEEFARQFRAPSHGRYVRQPAQTNAEGVVSLPPAPFDPVPFVTAAGVFAAGVALGAGYLDNSD